MNEVNKNISNAIDQLEEKRSLEQIKTNKKVDNLEEKIEKLGTKVITMDDLNEVNKNISDAIDQLEEKRSLEQNKTNQKVDLLKEKIEKLRTKVIPVEDLKEVNNNITEAIDQLEEKMSLEQIKNNKKVDQLEENIEKLEAKVITVEDLNEVNNNISDVIDQLEEKISLEHAVYHVKKVEEKGKNKNCLPTYDLHCFTLLQPFLWLVEEVLINQLRLSQQMGLPSAHFLTFQITELHTLWIITSCVEDLGPKLHVFVMLLGSGQNIEMTLSLNGMAM